MAAPERSLLLLAVALAAVHYRLQLPVLLLVVVHLQVLVRVDSALQILPVAVDLQLTLLVLHCLQLLLNSFFFFGRAVDLGLQSYYFVFLSGYAIGLVLAQIT